MQPKKWAIHSSSNDPNFFSSTILKESLNKTLIMNGGSTSTIASQELIQKHTLKTERHQIHIDLLG